MIIRLIFFLNLIFATFFISAAQSFDDNKKEFGFYFGTKIYEERHPVDNSFFMSQDGYMIGLIAASADYSQDLYFGWITRLAAGEVDYTSNGTGTMTGIPDYQFETTGYLGIPFEGSNYRITPFGGFGFRYLLNASGLKQSSTGHSGYDRESRYLYVPLGINVESSPVNNSYWEFRAEYLYFVYGQQTSYISQVSSNYNDITNDQEDGSGIKLTYKYHFDSSFGLEGYTDYWDIADSKLDVTGNFMEPRNTTTETGLRIFWSH